VVDTDIVVAGAGAFARPAVPSEPVETQLVRRWMAGQWRWVTSEELLTEYVALLIERGAPESRVYRVINKIGERARIVVPRSVPQSLPDPDDAHVIGTARAAGAPIVTRNTRHYPAGLVTVITPQQMEERIREYLKHPMSRRRK
jgi:predicted nucleic acid-binding protein